MCETVAEEILKCEHSNKSYRAVFSFGATCQFRLFSKPNFEIFGLMNKD